MHYMDDLDDSPMSVLNVLKPLELTLGCIVPVPVLIDFDDQQNLGHIGCNVKHKIAIRPIYRVSRTTAAKSLVELGKIGENKTSKYNSIFMLL